MRIKIEPYYHDKPLIFLINEETREVFDDRIDAIPKEELRSTLAIFGLNKRRKEIMKLIREATEEMWATGKDTWEIKE